MRRHRVFPVSGVDITAFLNHVEGGKHYELVARFQLPGVPRVGDRVYADRSGPPLEVRRVTWATDGVRLWLAPDLEARLEHLLGGGMEVMREVRRP